MYRRIQIIAIIILFVSINSYGQNPYFGIKGGLNLSHMILKDNDGWLTKKINVSPGFNAGGTMDYRIIPHLTLNVNLLVSAKGYQERKKEDFQNTEIKSFERLNLFYLELPIYVKYEFELGGFKTFAGGGPFVSYGYWGKKYLKREGGGESETVRQDVNWGSDPETDDYKPIDYGMGICFGGKIDNFVLDIGYNFSANNIAAKTDFGQVAHNGVLFVSVSYFFSKFYKYNEANY